MAERRMFTMKIVDSDAFLEMPLSAQALYFHLNMRADDDGFVNNPKKIQRMIGASEDDFKLLIAKRFVLIFESGVVVIKHWRMHNLLRKDRHHATQYQEEFQTLALKDNQSYTEAKNRLATTWQPHGNQLATEDSIGKDSIGKDSNIYSPKPKEIRAEFETLWEPYPRKQGKSKAYGYYERARKNGTTYEEVEQGIRAYIEYIKANDIDMQYVKKGQTFFSQKSWQDDWSIRYRQNNEHSNPFLDMLEKGDY